MVVESEVDESAQVDGRDPDAETVVVALHTAVADSPVAFGDEPGDGAFDHGPPLSVVVDEVTVGPRSTGGDEFGVMVAEGQCSSFGSGRATRPEWAASAADP